MSTKNGSPRVSPVEFGACPVSVNAGPSSVLNCPGQVCSKTATYPQLNTATTASRSPSPSRSPMATDSPSVSSTITPALHAAAWSSRNTRSSPSGGWIRRAVSVSPARPSSLSIGVALTNTVPPPVTWELSHTKIPLRPSGSPLTG